MLVLLVGQGARAQEMASGAVSLSGAALWPHSRRSSWAASAHPWTEVVPLSSTPFSEGLRHLSPPGWPVLAHQGALLLTGVKLYRTVAFNPQADGLCCIAQ